MTLLAIVLLTVAAFYLGEWACAARRRGIEAAIGLRQAFFAEATILVRDPRTPDSVVALLEACANSITRADIGRLVLRRALAHRLPSAEGDDEESRRLLQDVHAMPDALRRTLAEAAMHYAQAASFNNSLLGGLVRRLSALWLAGPANRGSDPSAARPMERLMIDITPRLIERERLPANS